MRSKGSRSLITIFIILALAVAARGAGSVQEADSKAPLWWTLTDAISPTELEATATDHDAHRARYEAAAEAGLVPPRDGAELQGVRVFYAGSMTPEVIAFWQAFDSFAVPLGSASGERFRARARHDLAHSGLGEAAVEEILQSALDFLAQTEALREELRPRQEPFMDILRDALVRLDRASYRRAVDARDAAALARVTGRDARTAAELMAVWERDPVAEAAAPALVALRRDLGPRDWQRFRTFLFHEVAPRITVFDISDAFPPPPAVSSEGATSPLEAEASTKKETIP